MKFVRLDLFAFGHFTRRALDFPVGGANFHLIHGSNEAGKSTTLRAISGLLYGIERQSTDAFLHEPSELRVGARLQHSSGLERTFVRRKGANATLSDEHGNPHDDADLQAWLSVQDRRQFEAMFGLGHEQLRRAGEALATSKTAVGEALFGAVLDGAALKTAMAQLEAAAEEILTPAGRAGSLVRALAQHREARKRQREHELPPAKWKELQQAILAEEKRRGDLVKEIDQLRADRHRLDRTKQVLPVLGQRASAIAARAAMGEVRLLALDAGERRAELTRALRAADEALEELSAKIALDRRARDLLDVPEALVAATPRITQLTQDFGTYKKAQSDRGGVIKEIVTHKQREEEILRELGMRGMAVSDVGQLAVDEAAVARIRALEKEGIALRTKLGQLRDDHAVELGKDEACQKEIASLPAARETTVLRATREQFRGSNLGAEAAAAEATATAAERASSLGALSLGVPADTLIGLAVPEEQVLRRFESEFGQHAAERTGLIAQQRELASNIEAIESDLSALSAAGPILSPEDLARTRRSRDEIGEELLRVWEAGGSTGHTGASGPPLVVSYRAAVRAADDAADALHRGAERMAKALADRAELAKRTAKARGVAAAIEALDGGTERLQFAWREIWLPTGVEPRSPSEMLEWRRRWEGEAESARRREEAHARWNDLRTRSAEQRCAFEAALALAGVKLPEGAPWVTVQTCVEALLTEASTLEAKATALGDEAARCATRAIGLGARIKVTQDEVDAWGTAWAAAVARIRLAADAHPDEVAIVLDRLGQLFAAEGKRQHEEKRVKAIEKQLAAFERGVAELIPELGVGISGTASECAEALNEMHLEALQAAQRRRDLDAQFARFEADRAAEERRRDRVRADLTELFTQTACASVEEVDTAVARSSEARRLDAIRSAAEQRLADIGEGWSLDALVETAEATDSDRVEADLTKVSEDLQAREREQHDRLQALGEMKGNERRFAASDDAALLATEVQTQVAIARDCAERYARLRLAAAVLRRGIERYRESNQNKILQRAEQFFARLTLGRYTRLRAEYDGDGASIRCLRGDESLQVRDKVMSDGTLDQLYLSLRLASIEQHLALQEPMPLVLDDIFIHFDDERAKAGLEVLAEVSTKTQVLLLTHHARNLELARQVLPPGLWQEHRLEARSPSAATPG